MIVIVKQSWQFCGGEQVLQKSESQNYDALHQTRLQLTETDDNVGQIIIPVTMIYECPHLVCGNISFE